MASKKSPNPILIKTRRQCPHCDGQGILLKKDHQGLLRLGQRCPACKDGYIEEWIPAGELLIDMLKGVRP